MNKRGERNKEQARHTPAMVSNEGVPRRSVIKSNWWATLLPGNSGFPIKTSANMQPMLQISIAGVYYKQDNGNKH